MQMRFVLVVALFSSLGGCGSDVGDPCTMAGQSSECGGDVCTALRGGGAACEAICQGDGDCDADSTCDQSGPDSKVKACRPKSSDDGDGGHSGGEGGH